MVKLTGGNSPQLTSANVSIESKTAGLSLIAQLHELSPTVYVFNAKTISGNDTQLASIS